MLNTINPSLVVQTRKNQELILQSEVEPGVCERSIIEYLRRWAQERPESYILAERGKEADWKRITYSEARQKVDSIAQALLDLGLRNGDKILILSENSLEHALLMLAAMTVGVSVVPISVGYSLLSGNDWSKLERIFSLIKPAMIFVQNIDIFSGAVQFLTEKSDHNFLLVSVSEGDSGLPVTLFDTLLTSTPGVAVEEAYEKTGLDTVAKIIFTSGSTGIPKGVITTQRMLCNNMAMQDAFWTGGENELPYTTLCWMPWSHSMAGNGLFNRSLRQGGTYYIDDGKPIGREFDKTIRNLKEISPHSYSDVPAGFAMLADALEADQQLNQIFFKDLKFLQYAGASLPDELWKRFQVLSIAVTGERIPFLTGYGCTEAGPLITQLYWPIEGSGVIGLPAPGLTLKLVPVDDGRYEIRARGENITPGYIANPEATRNAFDDEGFYITGDSVRFIDPESPIKGMRFSSRVVEDFKLQTGTFVQVGLIRTQLLDALMPWMSDFVITGENRAFLGALGWLNVNACNQLVTGELPVDEMVKHPAVIETIKTALKKFNDSRSGSASRIKRLMLLTEPPSSADNEITDKGYINQRRVLEKRSSFVDLLYSVSDSDTSIISFD